MANGFSCTVQKCTVMPLLKNRVEAGLPYFDKAMRFQSLKKEGHGLRTG